MSIEDNNTKQHANQPTKDMPMPVFQPFQTANGGPSFFLPTFPGGHTLLTMMPDPRNMAIAGPSAPPAVSAPPLPPAPKPMMADAQRIEFLSQFCGAEMKNKETGKELDKEPKPDEFGVRFLKPTEDMIYRHCFFQNTHDFLDVLETAALWPDFADVPLYLRPGQQEYDDTKADNKNNAFKVRCAWCRARFAGENAKALWERHAKAHWIKIGKAPKEPKRASAPKSSKPRTRSKKGQSKAAAAAASAVKGLIKPKKGKTGKKTKKRSARLQPWEEEDEDEPTTTTKSKGKGRAKVVSDDEDYDDGYTAADDCLDSGEYVEVPSPGSSTSDSSPATPSGSYVNLPSTSRSNQVLTSYSQQFTASSNAAVASTSAFPLLPAFRPSHQEHTPVLVAEDATFAALYRRFARPMSPKREPVLNPPKAEASGSWNLKGALRGSYHFADLIVPACSSSGSSDHEDDSSLEDAVKSLPSPIRALASPLKRRMEEEDAEDERLFAQFCLSPKKRRHISKNDALTVLAQADELSIDLLKAVLNDPRPTIP